MFPLQNKKKAVSVILGMHGNPDKEMPEAEGEESADAPLHAIAEDAISAMKAGDAPGFAAAMKAFYQAVDVDAGE